MGRVKTISVAGTIIADSIKMINAYPDKGMLEVIESADMSVGGCVPNTAITLARLGGIKVKAAGMVGGDEKGQYIINELKKSGVNTDSVIVNQNQITSFTDVMTIKSTGERTFFNLRGANSEYSRKHIDANAIDCEIFHFGYLLLMDSFDRLDVNGETELSLLFKSLQEIGIKTSLDVVSENSQRFKSVVTPALKYCHYAILNEIEAGMVACIEPRDKSGQIIESNIKAILQRFVELGVKKVFIHCPECGFYMGQDGEYIKVPSLALPNDYIKGAVGAGDAFCAGILYSLCNGLNDKEALKVASCTAAANLASSDSVGGAMDFEKTMLLEKRFERRK